MTELTQMSELVRKLCAGNPEGRQLFELLTEMSSVSACKGVWLRAIRAVAFDNLKLMQWSEFFQETFLLCETHAGADEKITFFSLLASQLLQRLVKAVAVTKGVTAETTANLKAFVDVMSAPDNTDKTLPSDMSAADHAAALADVSAALDFNAPPNQVMSAAHNLRQVSGHWAAESFALPQGRKILDGVHANAKSKESMADALEILSKVESSLRNSGLVGIDPVFSVAFQQCFNPKHAEMVSQCFQDLSAKSVKALKGNERDRLYKVQWLARSSVQVICCNHVVNDLLPHLRDFTQHINDNTAFDAVLLPKSACLMHLADVCDGEEGWMRKLKQFNEKVNHVASQVCGAEGMTDQDASKVSSAWKAASKAVLTTVGDLSDRVEAAGVDPQKQMAGVLEQLKLEVSNVGAAIELSMQGWLREGALATVKDCVDMLMSAAESPGQKMDDQVAIDFSAKVENAQLVSTILGEDGKTVKTGIQTASMLFGCLDAYAAAIANNDNAETSVGFVKSYLKLTTCSSSVLEDLVGLNAVVAVLSQQAQLKVTEVVKLLSDMSEKSLKTFVGQCSQTLDASFIEDNIVEVPEPIAKIDCQTELDDKLTALVKEHFGMERTKHISDKAGKLEGAINGAKKIADSLGLPPGDMLNIVKYETSYANAIKWLATGNVLYTLTTKVVRRAVLTLPSHRPKQSAR